MLGLVKYGYSLFGCISCVGNLLKIEDANVER